MCNNNRISFLIACFYINTIQLRSVDFQGIVRKVKKRLLGLHCNILYSSFQILTSPPHKNKSSEKNDLHFIPACFSWLLPYTVLLKCKAYLQVIVHPEKYSGLVQFHVEYVHAVTCWTKTIPSIVNRIKRGQDQPTVAFSWYIHCAT